MGPYTHAEWERLGDKEILKQKVDRKMLIFIIVHRSSFGFKGNVD